MPPCNSPPPPDACNGAHDRLASRRPYRAQPLCPASTLPDRESTTETESAILQSVCERQTDIPITHHFGQVRARH